LAAPCAAASSDNRDLILHIIEEVAAQVFIPLTVGGGIRKVEDVRLPAEPNALSQLTRASYALAFSRTDSGIRSRSCSWVKSWLISSTSPPDLSK
jgi:hypothetical protein